MKQKIFKKELVDALLVKVKSEDMGIIKLYLNKKKFEYPYKEGDLIISDIPEVESDLGEKLYTLQIRNRKDNRVADFECAKLLYESLEITPEQASNQQFWNYLHHHDCYQYIHARWDKIDDPGNAGIQKYIERHWLMTRTSQKHLINAPLSTLWWSIHITLDENRENKYELCKIYFGNNRYRTVSIGGSSFVRHKPAIHAILEYIQENNLEPHTDLGDDISKYINLLGGTKPLSFFEKDWFKKRIYEAFGNTEKYKAQTSDYFENKKTSVTQEKKDEDKGRDKIYRYFNIRDNGEYNLTKFKEYSFNFNIPIHTHLKSGYLLICYNQSGYINRVKICELLKRNRNLYKNGIYEGNIINTILITPPKAIIGIIYYINGSKYFKAILSDQLKDNNGNVGLQGYKTMYTHFDKIEYIVLPIEIQTKISKLIFKSLNASGKEFSNSYYRNEFTIIKEYIKKEELTLF